MLFPPTIIILCYVACARAHLAAAPVTASERDGFKIVDESGERTTLHHCASQDSNMVADGSTLEPASPDPAIDIQSIISTSCRVATAAISMLSVTGFAGSRDEDAALEPMPPSTWELISLTECWDPNADSNSHVILRTRSRVRGG